MKRFWLVLLSLGLIVAFSTSAMAVDVKVSGSFYAAGMYQDKTTLKQDIGPSTAFYYQQLRVNAEFIASPGLKLITRFDALERVWGASRSTPGTTGEPGSSGTRAENENIAFDNAYIYYASPIGLFTAGYQDDGTWGTAFSDNGYSVGKITYQFVQMPFAAGLQIGKGADRSKTAFTAATTTDLDDDFYTALVQFFWKGGEAGLLGQYSRKAQNRQLLGFTTKAFFVVPYVKAKIGPVAIEAEVNYLFGKLEDYETATADVTLSQWNAYIDALVDFGMFYAGGTAAYVSGDDPATTTKSEGGTLDGGAGWNPCLILFNWDRFFWAGTIPGYGDAANTGGAMVNAWFGQVRGGVRPIAALDIGASIAYATADKKPTGVLSKDYGWEVDVTATYKVTNNLSYMLGVGYLFTGDYYQGTSAANKIDNNFLVINKLTLTF
jgi:hypothetical protein